MPYTPRVPTDIPTPYSSYAPDGTYSHPTNTGIHSPVHNGTIHTYDISNSTTYA